MDSIRAIQECIDTHKEDLPSRPLEDAEEAVEDVVREPAPAPDPVGLEGALGNVEPVE